MACTLRSVILSVPLLLFAIYLFPSVAAVPHTNNLIKYDAAGMPMPGQFVRGINIGGWLLVEKWMNEDLFAGTGATDQWTFDQTANARSKLENHWSSYFTESDMSRLRQYGINTVRIPIGYWAYDNSNTPFISGADAYLEKAVNWARNNGMQVWIDLHGAPGSQNGFQNSGREGSVDWQKGMNLDHTTDVLKTIAAKYGKWEWSGTIVGIELVNEPVNNPPNNVAVTKQWVKQTYSALKSAAENTNLQLVMHDSFLGPSAWLDVVEDLRAEHGLWNTPLFSIDAHYYRVFGEDNSNYNQDDHINATCQWAAAELAAAGDASLPAYVGEFSAVTNICVNPDGTTTGGMSCSTPGCQCQTMTGWQDWDDQMVAQVRRFVEAQLDAFEAHSQGYFLWSLKAPNGWGFLNGIEKGFIPNPLTSRQFGQLC